MYKQARSNYILCHHENNDETIHILQQDGTIKDGFFRVRLANGSTAIGSKYFRRAGREEARVYRLRRYNTSRKIAYTDAVKGKDDKHWRELTKYTFNPETLEWTNALDR